MGPIIPRVLSISLDMHLAVDHFPNVVLVNGFRALGTRSTTRQFVIACDPHNDHRRLAEGRTWVPLEEFDNNCHLCMNRPIIVIWAPTRDVMILCCGDYLASINDNCAMTTAHGRAIALFDAGINHGSAD